MDLASTSLLTQVLLHAAHALKDANCAIQLPTASVALMGSTWIQAPTPASGVYPLAAFALVQAPAWSARSNIMVAVLLACHAKIALITA